MPRSDSFTSIGIANLPLVEALYEQYLASPAAVSPSWRVFFEENGQPTEGTPIVSTYVQDDLRVYGLIQAYRTYGHLSAQINPVAVRSVEVPHELRLSALGFRDSELHSLFPTLGMMPQATATLSEIIDTMRSIYCGKIGIEYMGLQNPEMEKWLQEQIEPNHFRPNLSIEQKRMIFQQLNQSELLESFIHTKYTGQKRFSLEGGETLIPIIKSVIDRGTQLGCEEYVLGMAHRGRLNVLANILNKSYGEIFLEFEEGYIPLSFEGTGDVKYHKGFASVVETTDGKKVKVSLTPNPSHLESVYPVVEGQVRAKQVQHHDDKNTVLPLIVHGDAAISGQGVVYETMQMYRLAGYDNGGTFHVVINNQIGFTTLPKDGRSTPYCTDIARAFNAPVFHVNSEDPEGCVYATLLSIELRHRFHCDVFIDLNCYRKYGHNEGDEPAFTQPLEYQLIRKKQSIREIYRDQLIQQSVVEKDLAEKMEEEFKASLRQATTVKKDEPKSASHKADTEIRDPFRIVETGVPLATLREIADHFSAVPEGFNLHSKLKALVASRLAMLGDEDKPTIDWGMAEHLAIGSLLWEGRHVRLSGQDTRRGTFSHRHAMWMDQVQDRKYFPLSKMKKDQGRFDVFNSPLSEFAALGFEFGYSVAYPTALVIWEAQFGDFANGAQVIIDQYISTAEQKWGLHFPLTLLLPHGYEGQGPEHSSGRIERFLVLCGEDNMEIVNPTTPAQLFHLLRRQLLRKVMGPLVVFTPKGLLRHPQCVSRPKDLVEGAFQDILDDPAQPKAPSCLVLCSGRVYYDLIAEREKHKVDDMAIIRVEQLYPFNAVELSHVISRYKGLKKAYWVQEEPSNMGAWTYIQPSLHEVLGKELNLSYVGRGRSASPAAGSYARHQQEHEAIMNALFAEQE